MSKSSDAFNKWLNEHPKGMISKIADAFGLSVNSVWEWSRGGSRRPSWEHRLALQIICGVDPHGWDPPKPSLPKDLERRARNFAAQLGAS